MPTFVEMFHVGDFPEMYVSDYKWSFLKEGADICESKIYAYYAYYARYVYDGDVYQHKFIRYYLV